MPEMNVDLDKLRKTSRSFNLISANLDNIKEELKEFNESLFDMGARRIRRESLLIDEAINHLQRCSNIIGEQSYELKRIANDIEDANRDQYKDETEFP